jgi:membrane-associated phospholipid phosphatase
MAAARHDTTPYKGHFALYAGGFVAALVVFGISAWLAAKGTATGWEYTWFHAVNGWSESWYRFMVIVTFFGSTMWAPIAVILAFLFRFYRLAWRMALSILGAYSIVMVAKHVVGRERPLALFHDAHARVAEAGMGFPSGHATLITVVTLTLLPYMPWKWRWTVPAAIVLVCLSRLYLGVHIPLDLIGGVAVGTGVVAFVRILPQPIRVLLRID